jgi:DNA-binding transcriptional ArsR family regulator
MKREVLHQLVMTIEHPEQVAEILSALDTENRVRTYHLLHEGSAPKEIAEQLDITRSALQPYLTDFKEAGLVEIEGKTYRFTEKGETLYELLEQVDKLHKDLSELQEFLVENPEVVPEEVLDEVEKRRSEE